MPKMVADFLRCGVMLLLGCGAWAQSSYRGRPPSANYQPPTTSHQSPTLAGLFPGANAVPGWSLKAAPKLYTGDQLFDYMDGAGEIPRSYGFRQLGSAKYQNGKTVLEAAIFDMGTGADAFGYYSARTFLERNPRTRERVVALEHPAFVYPGLGVLTCWKDHYTIVLQPETGKPDEAALLAFARAIGSKIRATGMPSNLLRRLPTANRVANTVRFVRGKSAFDALLLFLPQDVFKMAAGAEAAAEEITLSGQSATVFVVRYPSARAAGDASDAWRKYLTGRKANFTPGGIPDAFVAMAAKEKGVGAILNDNHLGVVIGAKDTRAVQTALQSLRGSLRSR